MYKWGSRNTKKNTSSIWKGLCSLHTRLSSLDKPRPTRVRVCWRTVYRWPRTVGNNEQQSNFLRTLIYAGSLHCGTWIQTGPIRRVLPLYKYLVVVCVSGGSTNKQQTTPWVHRSKIDWKGQRQMTIFVAPRRNWQRSTETQVPFGYLRFLSWFYFHKSMMYRQINLRETRSLETYSCDWPWQSVVHVSLCPQPKKPRGRSATCIHIIAQPLTAAFSKWFLRSQLPIFCFDEIIPLGASRVRVRVRDKIRRHNYVEA